MEILKLLIRNINANSSAFGNKIVKSMTLHWDQRGTSDYSGIFDLIVASDCTFFKDFHKGLAQTIKCLLKKDERSQALLLSPKRGDSLDKFLVEITDSGLHFSVTEVYNTEIWSRHQQFVNGNDAWPNYEKDHCYPLLVAITS